MKIRAVVLDLTGHALDWLNVFGNEDNLELCEILTLSESSPIPLQDLNNYDNWDYLLVFEKGVNESVRRLLNHIGIDERRVIYPLDDVSGSLYEHRFISSYIFTEYIGGLLDYYTHRKNQEKYAMVSVDDLSYINASSDNVILPEMIRRKRNWAYDDMELFYQLSGEYFEFNDNQTVFCDIGANIGTTCIYFKKKLDKDIRILAFEPSSENYKLLRCNALLNDIDESQHLFENVGLSDKNEEAVISYSPYNPGESSVTNDCSDIKEKVNLITFDDYLDNAAVLPEEIKYLWIDVEGNEARFLAGAKKTLEKINVPIIMEFFPKLYFNREGEFEKLIEEICRYYKYFIRMDAPHIGKQPTEDLRNYKNNIVLQWDLFLLKE